ncbi:MAG TPA: hypothetical protein VFG93_04435 [Gaiellaceae bacterium]|nr:hypothetical protein [Gaiellaceae bacterium]
MNTTESFEALRRANPRAQPGFAESVEAAAHAVRARMADGTAASEPQTSFPRRRLVCAVVAALLAAAAAVAALSTIGSRGAEDATAAVKKAASVTAASAERSGTAVVRITHDGKLWAGTTIRWHGDDLGVRSDAPSRRGRAGSELLVVDGIVYGLDPDAGGWVMQGKPENIDPGSGTTPDEYLAAVREDVGGVTLRRITASMTGLIKRPLDDGSTVYSGTVAAGLIARESGFKGGQAIRVLPFGLVAHDEAADPSAPLQAAITVGADGVIREIAVTWGSSEATWTYTVTYKRLGTTAAPEAPANARPLRDRSP